MPEVLSNITQHYTCYTTQYVNNMTLLYIYPEIHNSRLCISNISSMFFDTPEVACSASDRQGSNFESCVWRTVSSQSSHHPQEVLLAQFSLYVHKGGLKPDSFHFFDTPCMIARLYLDKIRIQ